ncbi:MAG: phosphotransferase, partial [Myxococcales bacterium]|nr:phosphotransferase [Myxococcales bacterium]
MNPLVAQCAARVPAALARFLWPEGPSRWLSGGSANISFVVEGAAPVIVSFCVEKSADETARVAEVLRCLEAAGAPTSRVVIAPDGAASAVIDGVPVMLRRYVEGAPLARVDASAAHTIGAALARVHATKPPDGLPAGHAYWGRRRLAEWADAATHTAFGAWLASVVDACPPPATLPIGLVHGDLFPDNVIRGPDGAMTLIDFEEACVDEQVADLGMTIAGLDLVGAFTAPIVEALV